MAKGRLKNRDPHTKIVASHSARVEGLSDFLMKHISPLEEVVQIRPGRIKSRSITAGGGFSFKATHWALVGNRITAIKCDASYGATKQEVFLIGPDLEALRQRLVELGFGGGFS